MSKLIKLLIVVVIGGLILIIAFNNSDRADTIRINGSTTIAPFMRKAVSEYQKNRDIEIIISESGSISGIDSLISGSCDIAMSSNQIIPEQLEKAEKAGVSVKSYLLGYDIITPIVHPDNPVSTISLEQLADVYAGKIRNWSELGGKDTVIGTVSRKKNSGTYCSFCRIFSPVETELSVNLDSNSSVLAYIAENANAIGYISKSYLNPEVKVLAVDGLTIKDEEKLIKNHPIKRPLYLYANEKKLNNSLKAFIIFILMNEKSKSLFRENGFFPVHKLEVL